MSEGQKPSVGRIVHYGQAVAPKNGPKSAVAWAAIITAVHDNQDVNLRIFHPTCDSDDHAEHVKFSSVLTPDCWTWPPRV